MDGAEESVAQSWNMSFINGCPQIRNMGYIDEGVAQRWNMGYIDEGVAQRWNMGVKKGFVSPKHGWRHFILSL